MSRCSRSRGHRRRHVLEGGGHDDDAAGVISQPYRRLFIEAEPFLDLEEALQVGGGAGIDESDLVQEVVVKDVPDNDKYYLM
jgi:hypothetical protein